MRTSSWRRCGHAIGGEIGGGRGVSEYKPYYRICIRPSNLRTSLPLSSAGGPATPHVAARALLVLQLGRAHRILLRLRKGGRGCGLVHLRMHAHSASLPSPPPILERKVPSDGRPLALRGEARGAPALPPLFHPSILPSHRPTQVKYGPFLRRPSLPSSSNDRLGVVARRPRRRRRRGGSFRLCPLSPLCTYPAPSSSAAAPGGLWQLHLCSDRHGSGLAAPPLSPPLSS